MLGVRGLKSLPTESEYYKFRINSFVSHLFLKKKKKIILYWKIFIYNQINSLAELE